MGEDVGFADTNSAGTRMEVAWGLGHAVVLRIRWFNPRTEGREPVGEAAHRDFADLPSSGRPQINPRSGHPVGTRRKAATDYLSGLTDDDTAGR